MLTAKRLKECLAYDPLTGVFIWVTTQGRAVSGMLAGSPHKDGYIQIKIDRVLHKAHRLAWLYVHGTWPQGRLDHKDNDHSNNRVNNLRLATHSQNMANRKLNANNAAGFKGVSKKGRRYQANINKDGTRHSLGCFDTPEEAASAYRHKARELFGEFARVA